MSRPMYVALKEAGVSEDKATAAAHEIALFEERLRNIESKLSLLIWMVGTNITLTFILLGRLFFKP